MKTKIYALCDPEGDVRYIGKTVDKDRFSKHLSDAKSNKDDCKTHRCRWIKSLLDRGEKPTMVKIGEYGDDWAIYEKANIAFYRSISIHGKKLTNATDGGDGLSGHIYSEEHKQKLSLVRIGKKHTKESKRKVTESLKQTYDDKRARNGGVVPLTDLERASRKANGLRIGGWNRLPQEQRRLRDERLVAEHAFNATPEGKAAWLAKRFATLAEHRNNARNEIVPLTIGNATAVVPARGGRILIDAEDWPKVAPYAWHIIDAKARTWKHVNGRRSLTYLGKLIIGKHRKHRKNTAHPLDYRKASWTPCHRPPERLPTRPCANVVGKPEPFN
jgi:hypothetical protein